ncbi:MAG: hypothetical protein IJ618_11280 [Prevotella sp.]|nr:hypothetical protein [Prevotella sp.]
MTIEEAINARHSVRAYKAQPLTEDLVKVLEKEIEEQNRKEPGTYVLEEREVIKAYIAIGYGESQGVGHKIKTVEKASNASDITPSWFRKGVEAALLAPTAVNQQKFFFEYVPARDNKPAQVIAKRNFSLIGYTQLDLGIAKYHFEIGAGKDNFEWSQH